jgi:hypothetical protein
MELSLFHPTANRPTCAVATFSIPVGRTAIETTPNEISMILSENVMYWTEILILAIQTVSHLT